MDSGWRAEWRIKFEPVTGVLLFDDQVGLINSVIDRSLRFSCIRKLHLHAEALGIDEDVGSGGNSSDNLL
jgi:hypothetical protein